MTNLPPASAPNSLAKFVTQYASSEPDRPALASDGAELTYSQLDTAIHRLAKAFLSAGVAKGDRIATLQTPRPEFVVAWLAAASIGAIWVGLNPKYRLEELAQVVRDAEPKILLTRSCVGDRDYKNEIKTLTSETATIEKVIVFDGDPPVDGTVMLSTFLEAGEPIDDSELARIESMVQPDDPCAIVYTSGSTGVPKGALLSHGAIAAFAIAQNRFWPVNPQRNVNFLPINHIGCLCDVTMPCLAAGGTLFLMEQFDPEAATRLIDKAGLTIWGSVPTVFGMQIATEAYRSLKGDTLQLIVWEGAAMPRSGIETLLALGVPMATNYSMTESVGSITAVAPTRDIDILDGSVGPAFTGVEIKLLGERGRPDSDEATGEVAIRSPYLFSGYWRRPQDTADAFTADGFFRTGDLAKRGPNGALRLVGRLKEMFKSGGYNVYPREIEAVLESHPAVAMAAVVSVDDPVWQEVGIAYAIPKGQVTIEELRSWCADRLANYKIPKHIVITDDLPILPIGKIDKITLKRQAMERGTAGDVGNRPL